MNQLKAGAVLNYVIIGLNTIVGLAYTPYMLRCLGQNEYGLYSLVASIIAYLTLLDFGFGPAVVRFTAKYRAEGKKEEQYSLFGLFLKLYTLIGIIAFCIGLVLYFNIDRLFDRTMSDNEIIQARIMILLLLFNLAFTFPMSVFGSIITAYERFIFQKSMLIFRIVFSHVVMIGVLFLGYKAIALVVIQTVFNLIILSANYIYCKRKLHIKLRFDSFNKSFIRQLIGFSIWVFVGDIMFKFYYNTGQFVLGATSGTVAVSIFALGVTLMQMYIMFSGGISGVLLPKLTTMVTKEASHHEIASVFLRVGRLQFFILSLVLSGFIIFGRQFIIFWAGDGYGEVYAICLIFFFTTLIPLIQNTGIIILQARNEQKFRSLMLLIVGALSLFLQVFLSKIYGAVGCAIAVGLANIVGQGIILNYYYHMVQHLEIITFWKEIVKMMIMPSVLTAVCLHVIQYIEIGSFVQLLFWIAIYICLFIPLCFRFSLNGDERRLFCEPIKKLINRTIR